jgi:hypothetical protein
MKLVINYEDHYGCFHHCVSRLIGDDWNEKPFPAISVLDSRLAWCCICLHFTGLSGNVVAFFDMCTARPYDSCFDQQQINNHGMTHVLPEVTN